MPKWMQSIDEPTPVKSLGLGVLVSGLNPKNLMLTAAPTVSIVQAELSTTEAIVALAIFILIASSSLAAPVLVYLVMGDKADETLNEWKTWLTANNAAVMAVVLLVLGMAIAGKGLGGLIG